MQDKLAALATQLEAITSRIMTLGLSRTADDLRSVSVELRRMQGSVSANRSPAPPTTTPAGKRTP